MPVSKSRRKKSNGQRVNAGRFAFSGHASQWMAMRLAGCVFLLAAILVLASSALSDPVQGLVTDSVKRVDGAVEQTVLNTRAALLRHTAMRPDGVRDLSRDEMVVLFGEPSLQRHEGPVVTWQFASGECALDVYFKEGAQRPVYAEYRVRGSAEGKAPVAMLDHRSCVKSLFVKFGGSAPQSRSP